MRERRCLRCIKREQRQRSAVLLEEHGQRGQASLRSGGYFERASLADDPLGLVDRESWRRRSSGDDPPQARARTISRTRKAAEHGLNCTSLLNLWFASGGAVSSRAQDTWFSATGPGFESPYRYQIRCQRRQFQQASRRTQLQLRIRTFIPLAIPERSCEYFSQ